MNQLSNLSDTSIESNINKRKIESASSLSYPFTKKRRLLANYENQFKTLPQELLSKILTPCSYSTTSLVCKSFFSAQFCIDNRRVSLKYFLRLESNSSSRLKTAFCKVFTKKMQKTDLAELEKLTFLSSLDIKFRFYASDLNTPSLTRLTSLIIKSPLEGSHYLKNCFNDLRNYTNLKILKTPYFDHVSLAFTHLKELTHLSLSFVSSCNRTLNDISSLINLNKLDLFFEIKKKLFSQYSNWVQLTRLTRLSLINMDLHSSLSHLNCLAKLKLSLDCIYAEDILIIEKLTSLKILKIECNAVHSSVDFSKLKLKSLICHSRDEISYDQQLQIIQIHQLSTEKS